MTLGSCGGKKKSGQGCQRVGITPCSCKFLTPLLSVLSKSAPTHFHQTVVLPKSCGPGIHMGNPFVPCMLCTVWALSGLPFTCKPPTPDPPSSYMSPAQHIGVRQASMELLALLSFLAPTSVSISHPYPTLLPLAPFLSLVSQLVCAVVHAWVLSFLVQKVGELH